MLFNFSNKYLKEYGFIFYKYVVCQVFAFCLIVYLYNMFQPSTGFFTRNYIRKAILLLIIFLNFKPFNGFQVKKQLTQGKRFRCSQRITFVKLIIINHSLLDYFRFYFLHNKISQLSLKCYNIKTDEYFYFRTKLAEQEKLNLAYPDLT